jgi:23S rRNA (uridine2552-2'-O)-methyltransferase
MRQNPYKKPDRFTVAAKKAGFPARSVFKLEEIDRRVRLLRPGMKVLDLGAAPGSWMLYAAKQIGPSGKILAIDLKPLNLAAPANAKLEVGDALTLDNAALAAFAPYDVVLSDMAPSTTGIRFADQARSYELFMRALEVAGALLRPGGTFVGKIFMGEDLPAARVRVRELFEKERIIRPEGTRTQSYELFVIGERRRASAPTTKSAHEDARRRTS